MTARDIHELLNSLETGWVNWEMSVDTFKAGSPDTHATGIAVGWKANIGALKEATAKGCNVFVCHEPLYYDHRDEDKDICEKYDLIRAKRDWIDEHGIAVMRCHDVWDQMPGIGIPDSWASLLELGEPLPESDGLFKAFDVSGRTAIDVAKQVAGGVCKLGQECVQLVGDPDAPVTRLALGTGAITPLQVFIDKLKADICIMTDDGYNFCCDGGLAQDLGVPLIVVNHCVAEDHGMALLSEKLREEFADVDVHHISQATAIRLVTP